MATTIIGFHLLAQYVNKSQSYPECYHNLGGSGVNMDRDPTAPCPGFVPKNFSPDARQRSTKTRNTINTSMPNTINTATLLTL